MTTLNKYILQTNKQTLTTLCVRVSDPTGINDGTLCSLSITTMQREITIYLYKSQLNINPHMMSYLANYIWTICNINFLKWSFWQTDCSLHNHDYSFISRLMNWMWEVIKWMTTIFKTHYASLQWNRKSVDRSSPMGLLLDRLWSIVQYIVKTQWIRPSQWLEWIWCPKSAILFHRYFRNVYHRPIKYKKILSLCIFIESLAKFKGI